MTLIKKLLGTVALLGMTMCHPVMANPVLTEASCKVADAHTKLSLQMMNDGYTNLEILAWLDSVTPDVRKEPQGYLGILWAKLNVSGSRAALNRAYKPTAIQQKALANCIINVNQPFRTIGQ